MSNGTSANIATSILTSVLTSAMVTMGILFMTGTLRLPGSDDGTEPTKKMDTAPEETTVETPALKGLTTDIAADVLKSRGLRLVVLEERADDEVPNGQICEQDPLADSMLNTGGAVEVVVSTGPNEVTVPDVSEKPLEDAKQLLIDAGLKIGNITESDTGTPGTVVGTIPEKGTATPRETTVDITVTGAPTVPKIVGMRLAKGKTALTDAGLKVGRIKWGYSDYMNTGVIIRQDPKADAVVAPGTEVTITVNSD